VDLGPGAVCCYLLHICDIRVVPAKRVVDGKLGTHLLGEESSMEEGPSDVTGEVLFDLGGMSFHYISLRPKNSEPYLTIGVLVLKLHIGIGGWRINRRSFICDRA